LYILTWWFCDSSVADPRLDPRYLGFFYLIGEPKIFILWVFSLKFRILFQDIFFFFPLSQIGENRWCCAPRFGKEVILETKENHLIGKAVVDWSTSWPSYLQQPMVSLLTKGFFYINCKCNKILVRIFYFVNVGSCIGLFLAEPGVHLDGGTSNALLGYRLLCCIRRFDLEFAFSRIRYPG